MDIHAYGHGRRREQENRRRFGNRISPKGAESGRRCQRSEEIQFFLQLHGLWEGIIDMPPPPAPTFEIGTMEPLERWIP